MIAVGFCMCVICWLWVSVLEPFASGRRELVQGAFGIISILTLTAGITRWLWINT